MINRVVLVGRLTKDAELRYLANGTAVCTFTLAVGRTFKKDETDYIPIVVWKKSAENTASYTHKGSLVGVDGRIQTRNYDGNDGKKVYVTEVVADSVQFLDSKKESKPQSEPQPTNNDPFANDGTPIDLDDSDLPF